MIEERSELAQVVSGCCWESLWPRLSFSVSFQDKSLFAGQVASVVDKLTALVTDYRSGHVTRA